MSEISAENKIRYNEVLFKFERAGRYGEVVVNEDTDGVQSFTVRKRNFFGWLVSNVRFTLNIGGYKEKVLRERHLVLDCLQAISGDKEVQPRPFWDKSAEKALQADLRDAKDFTTKGGAYRQKIVTALRQHTPISLSVRKVTTPELIRLYSKSYQIDDKSVKKIPEPVEFVRIFERDPSLGFNRNSLDVYLKESDFFQDFENLDLAKGFALFLLSSDKLPNDNGLLFLWNECGTVDPHTGNLKSWKYRGVNMENSYFRGRAETLIRSDENPASGQTTGKNEPATSGAGRAEGAEEVKTKKSRAEKSADRFLAREWVQFRQAKAS